MPDVFRLLHPAGFHMTLGARLRPRDPREDFYNFELAVAPQPAIDFSQFYSLSRYTMPDNTIVDLRPDIEDQNRLGACSAYSGVAGARVAARQSGRYLTIPPMLTGDYVYELARKKEGSFPADAGSTLADCDDIIIAGAPLESAYPEHHDAAYDYGTIIADYLTPQIWTAAHHPIMIDQNLLQNICTALIAGMAIHLGQSWPSQWFNPVHGVVDITTNASTVVGEHATYIWGYVPQGLPNLTIPNNTAYLACANQWTPGWSADAPASGVPDMRPGDYLIPIHFATDSSPLLWEYRAITARPYVKPQPTPPQSYSDRFWQWLTPLGAQALQQPEPVRASWAQVLKDTTKSFYPNLT